MPVVPTQDGNPDDPQSDPSNSQRSVRTKAQRAVVAVSLAHLLSLSMYEAIGALDPFQADEFLFSSGISWIMFILSATAAPFSIGTVLWLIEFRLRRIAGARSTAIRQTLFLALASIAGLMAAIAIIRTGAIGLLGDINLQLVSLIRFMSSANWAIPVTVLVLMAMTGGVYVISFVRNKLTRVAFATLLILAPWTVFTMFGSLSLLVLADSQRSEPENLTPLAIDPGSGLPNKVVIVVFDGLGYEAIFEDSVVKTNLLNFRNLAEHSLVFHDITSFPGGTKVNIPMILTGSYPSGRRTDDDRGQSNLFDSAGKYGYQLIVDGFYIQYCTRFVGNRGKCSSNTTQLQPPNVLEALIQPYLIAIHKVLPNRIETAIGNLIGPTGSRLFFPRIVQFDNFHNRVLTDLGTEKRLMRFAHYEIPHRPFWKRHPESGALQRSNHYRDSVAVTDSYLGDILDTLGATGQLEETMIVVVSDHGLRGGIERVPLIVRLPGLESTLPFTAKTNLSFVRPLIEALLGSDSFERQSVLDTVTAIQ